MKCGKFLNEKFTRRGLLKSAGILTAGVAGISTVTSGGLSLLSNADAKIASTETWPWPYVKLDPQKTAEIAYNEWYRVFCGAAVISSVFSQLREKVGEPYTLIPIDAFTFLEGGMSGWGTICGSNAGANIVTNLIIGPRTSGTEDGMLMGSEILHWYSEAAMPTYTPKDPRVKSEIPKTTSDSPLCHISVGKWMKAAGKTLSSPERRDRCARVTASVAFYLSELLNAWKDGKYNTKGTIPSKAYGITAQNNCMDCHGSNIPAPPSSKK
ncbi:MAG: C-GCAxxG-C-C family protein [Nitrospirota bacterium]